MRGRGVGGKAHVRQAATEARARLCRRFWFPGAPLPRSFLFVFLPRPLTSADVTRALAYDLTTRTTLSKRFMDEHCMKVAGGRA